MEMIAPEILKDVSGLSVGLCVTGLLLGLALWLFGWRRHRFWVVVAITCGGGVYGLCEAPLLHAQPAVAGTLLALAAGVLALSLARVLAFGAGGVATLLAVQSLVPSWDQPLVSFVTGGLLGVLLFQIWVMILTSLAGTLLMTYSLLCLLERLARLDAAAFAEKRVNLLNWICGGVASVGVLGQLLINRRRTPSARPAAPEKPKAEEPPPPTARTFWSWPPFRKAG